MSVLTKKQREDFICNNWKLTTLKFKWSKSGVCRLYDSRNEKTNLYAGGWGYDKMGTVLGQFIENHFNEHLKKLSSKKFYGLTHYNKNNNKRRVWSNAFTKTTLDGACGFSCMQNILKKIGFRLEFISDSSNSTIYKLRA
tara:strand:+ start:650 stop:1069 length:420 start_codon:yes stop_codon:yes gene_type:complete